MIHRLTLLLLYLFTVVSCVYLIVIGSGYYALPLTDRPHSVLHDACKPSGVIGHGLGMIGSALMLILLLYSLRKRFRLMQRMGNIRYWLNYHIWMGITGPLLVIFHTAFKLGGIVSISFWSMIAVALSGVLGRYIYIQIPHSLTGQELSLADLEKLDRSMQEELRTKHGLSDELLARINAASGTPDEMKTGWSGLALRIAQDLALRGELSAIQREIRAKAAMKGHELAAVKRIIRRKVSLRRRMAFVNTARALLHHWHIIHRPFAAVMLIIMTVHVIIAILFGYTWVFETA